MTEQDIRDGIKDALDATNLFNGVHVTGQAEEYGISADEGAMAIIEANSTSETSMGDDVPAGAIVYTAKIDCTFVARNPDPTIRDRLAERLRNVAGDKMNGKTFGLPDMLPALTRFTGWTWKKPESCERKIKATFQATYMIDGWDSMDTEE